MAHELAFIVLFSYVLATLTIGTPAVCTVLLAWHIDDLDSNRLFRSIHRLICRMYLTQNDIAVVFPNHNGTESRRARDRVFYDGYDVEFYFYGDPEAYAADWNRQRALRRQRHAHRIVHVLRLLGTCGEWALSHVWALLALTKTLLDTVYDRFWDLVAKFKAVGVGRRSRCPCEDTMELPITNETSYQELLLGNLTPSTSQPSGLFGSQDAGFGLSVFSTRSLNRR